MATAVVHETPRDSETFAPGLIDDTFSDGCSDTSSYKSFKDVIEEAPQDELNSELPLEESSSLDEQQAVDCKIPKDLLLKLKSYIFMLSQKKKEFSLDDLRNEFNDKLEVPSNVELRYELQKLGIVVLTYVTCS